jgi:hypothetical protein
VPPAPPAVSATAVEAGASGPPLPAPTGPGPTTTTYRSRKPRRDQVPESVYDDLPEARGFKPAGSGP